jgi:glyoxylase-like metal-dependent hydrolase (beta-lactamase superfamily II)
MMKIIPLSEGSFTVDQTKQFVPFDPVKESLNDKSRGSLLVEVQPFIVITGKDVILLDTGLGWKIDGVPQLLINLRNAGIDPVSITKVFLSHLHKDHAGGVGGKELAIPNAKYYVQKNELSFAFEKGFPSYITDDLQCLRDNDRVELLDGNGAVDGYIKYELTSAHSRWHQVVWIKENDETIFFGGDDAPQLQQMKHRFVAKYDYDGRKSAELRKEWWERGTNEHWKFLFYHDIGHAVAG